MNVLRAFEVVARHSSFIRAAEEPGIEAAVAGQGLALGWRHFIDGYASTAGCAGT